MKFNGINLREVHPLVSLDHCGVSGWRRDVRRIAAAERDMLAYARDDRCEFYALVNISGRTPEQGEEALAAVRAWAAGDGGVHEIDDGKSPGEVLDGMLQEIDEPEMVHGFGTVRIRWALEEPHKRDSTETTVELLAGGQLEFGYIGTAETYAVYEIAMRSVADELEVLLDDEPLFYRTAKTQQGSVLIIDTQNASATIDGADAGAETDWTRTDYDRPLRKGQHVLSCSATARLTARWYNRWA